LTTTEGLVAADDVTVPFDDPAIRWVQATNLVRELSGCTILPLAEVVARSVLS
jgi:hypothetical protein